MDTLDNRLDALATKAIWAASAGRMTELMPDDVRLLQAAVKELRVRAATIDRLLALTTPA